MPEDKPPRKPRVQLYDDELPAPPPEVSRSWNYGRTRPDELSKIEMDFCWRWTSHYNAARAAMQAGYDPARASVYARRLLADSRIQKQVALIEADRLRRMRFDGDRFLAEELLLATADVTQLQECWIPPCRHCWGKNFQYQRTHAEFEEAFESWMRLPDKRRRQGSTTADLGYGDVLVYDDTDKKIPFDQKGGDGYDVEQPPNPACPNCFGRGMEIPGYGSVVHIRQKDTRELSGIGKLLFAGAKHGPRGPEVMVRDRDAARHRLMTMVAKFLELRAAGQVINQSPQPGQPGIGFGLGVVGSVADLLTADPRSMTDQQLAAYLASHGVVIEDDGSGGAGTDSGGDSGDSPPPGYIA